MAREKSFFQRVKETFVPLLSLSATQDIIVFSDTRWANDDQHLRQVMTRLARRRKILFIEEPIPFYPLDKGKVTISHPIKNITVLQPKINVEDFVQDLPLLIAKQLRSQKLRDPILWFSSETFSDIIPFLNHSLIIYEFMNKQQFRYSYSPQESYLFSTADIIFTDERVLYEERKKRFQNLYYLQTNKKQVTEADWDTIIYQMQKIIHNVSKTKIRTGKWFMPSYYPLITQLTTSR